MPATAMNARMHQRRHIVAQAVSSTDKQIAAQAANPAWIHSDIRRRAQPRTASSFDLEKQQAGPGQRAGHRNKPKPELSWHACSKREISGPQRPSSTQRAQVRSANSDVLEQACRWQAGLRRPQQQSGPGVVERQHMRLWWRPLI